MVAVGFGNNCEHQSGILRDIYFKTEYNRPKVLQWMMQRIRNYFNRPDKYFTDLNENNKKIKDKSRHRYIRSEGRESLMQLSLILFNSLELSTMTIRKDDYALNSVTLNELTNEGNLLSLSRAKRALGKLVKGGYVKVKKQFENTENIYHAFASIKEIMPKFFIALGMAKYYSFSKSYKLKKMEKKELKRKNKMERFDPYILFGNIKHEKVSKGTVKVVTSQDIKEMRKELYEMMREKADSKYHSGLMNIVNSYPYDTLKNRLEYYRNNKPPP